VCAATVLLRPWFDALSCPISPSSTRQDTLSNSDKVNNLQSGWVWARTLPMQMAPESRSPSRGCPRGDQSRVHSKRSGSDDGKHSNTLEERRLSTMSQGDRPPISSRHAKTISGLGNSLIPGPVSFVVADHPVTPARRRP